MQIKSIHFLRMPVTSIFLFHINKKIQCHFDPVRLCGLFWGWGRVRKLFLNLDIQIENFHFLSIALSRIFNVNPIQGHFWPFEAVFRLFWIGVGSKNCFGVSSYRLSTFIFSACHLPAFPLLTKFRVILWLGSGHKTVLES